MWASLNYFPIQKGRFYRKIGEGRDFYIVKWNGRPIHIPKYIFEKRYQEEQKIEEPMYEELL